MRHDYYNKSGEHTLKRLNTFLITLFSYMIVFHFIINMWHGPPISYLHGKKTYKIGRNLHKHEQWIVLFWTLKNDINTIGIFNDNATIDNKSREWYWDEQWFLHIVPGVKLHPNVKFSMNVWIRNESS